MAKKKKETPPKPKKDEKLKVNTTFENLLNIAANTPKKKGKKK